MIGLRAYTPEGLTLCPHIMLRQVHWNVMAALLTCEHDTLPSSRTLCTLTWSMESANSRVAVASRVLEADSWRCR